MKFGILWVMDRRERDFTAPPEITKGEGRSGTPETSLLPGVSEKTYKFLIAAKGTGAFENLDARERNLIGIYFWTEASLSDLTAIAGVKGKESVSRIIRSGMKELWRNLPFHLQEKHPLEEVIKLKNYKGDKYPPRIRKRITAGLKKKWSNDAEYRERVLGSRRNQYGPEKELWKYATSNDLLPQMVAKGRVKEGEIEILRGFFEEKGNSKKPPEGLLNRFSIAVARAGARLS